MAKRNLTDDNEEEKVEDQQEEKKKKLRDDKDVTILCDLKKAGLLDFLWEKVGELKNIEHSECLKSNLSLDPNGYCKNLRLMKKGLKHGIFTPEMKKKKCFSKEDFQWSATGLVLVKNGHDPPASNHEASHLCNHPWCLNVKHLVWETPKKNYKRKNCITETTCPCPCGHTFNPCKHNPQCIKCNIHECKHCN